MDYKEKLKITAIILIGGDGKRFKSDIPKQFHMLAGKKVYLHTLEVFNKVEIFDEIIIVANKKYFKKIKEESPFKIKLIEAGRTRQLSVYNALLGCNKDTDIVMIHDGVRPFISKDIICENIERVKKYKAVDTCINSYDTIVQSINKDKIDNIPKRSSIFRGQTPQTFDYKIIKKAHDKALKEGITDASDDCLLVLKLGYNVYIVEGDEYNIKITTALDLFIAEQIFRIKSCKINTKKKNLKNKKFVLIGASGGIGSCVFNFLKKEKAKIIPLSRNSEFKLDLKDQKNIKNIFEKIFKKYDKIDGLINCAGILKRELLKKMKYDDIKSLVDVNLLGLILCCKEAKIKKGGHIINVASSSYYKGRKFLSVYSATKAAVVNFTQALSEELLDLNINVVIPSRTNTKMRRDNFPEDDKELLVSPEKVASTIVELLKNNITGNIIEIKSEA